ncbi:hypothetical protein D3C85_15430 [compost metagenome]
MSQLDTLLASVSNFSDKVKAAIAAGDLSSVAQVDDLMLQLRQEMDEQTVLLGIPAGGDVGVAITEQLIDLGAGSLIDCALANHFLKTIAGATTFSVTRVPVAGRVCTFTLRLTNGGSSTVTWFGAIKWSEGTAPTLTAAGTDVIAFTTYDGGVTWEGYLLGKDMKPVA